MFSEYLLGVQLMAQHCHEGFYKKNISALLISKIVFDKNVKLFVSEKKTAPPPKKRFNISCYFTFMNLRR